MNRQGDWQLPSFTRYFRACHSSPEPCRQITEEYRTHPRLRPLSPAPKTTRDTRLEARMAKSYLRSISGAQERKGRPGVVFTVPIPVSVGRRQDIQRPHSSPRSRAYSCPRCRRQYVGTTIHPAHDTGIRVLDGRQGSVDPRARLENTYFEPSWL